jgi:amidase
MNGSSLVVAGMLFALSAASGALCHAQGRNDAFQPMETTIEDIHTAFKSGLTARRLVQAYLDRIAAYDKQGPTINSIITLNDHALEDADRLDAAYKASGPIGPLHGIPVLVKDEIDTAGMPTTLGTQVFKDYRPPRDAFAIEKLRKAGAIILGKTTLSEYAAGDTYGSMFGVTRNPYDLERTVGGSSGGSGAALAANFSTVAIGEETFASIRRPAGWNAVASLRPTPGLVSRSGMWDGYPSPTAQMGPMARTVKDLVLLLDSMVGYDPEDPVTALGVGMAEGSYTKYLDPKGLSGARIGVLREPIGVQSEPESSGTSSVRTSSSSACIFSRCLVPEADQPDF